MPPKVRYNMTNMQVVVESLDTHYERLGDDKHKKILILHGWNDSLKGWQAMQATLAKTYDVLAVDLPGFGRTDMPPGVWGIDNYTGFVAAFLKKVKFKPFTIIGHNSGGAIAVRGLAQGKLKAERLLLLGSSGIRSEWRGRQNVWQFVTKTGKIVTAPLPKKVKKYLRHKAHMTIGSGNLVETRMQDTFKNIVTDDIQSDAAQLKLPTLIIYGEDDLSTPPAYGRILHNLIGGSRLEILPETGHFPHLDRPETILAMTEGFIEK